MSVMTLLNAILLVKVVAWICCNSVWPSGGVHIHATSTFPAGRCITIAPTLQHYPCVCHCRRFYAQERSIVNKFIATTLPAAQERLAAMVSPSHIL